MKGGGDMRDFFRELWKFFRKGDMVLLILCLTTSAFGCVVLSSVTNAEKFGDSSRYLIIQLAATALGVVCYAVMSSIDVDFFSEHRLILVGVNLFLLLLLIPFGTDNNTGNTSWLDFKFLPFFIQPAEICKIFFILTMASVMASHQSRISRPFSVAHMAFHLLLIAGVNYVISDDAGVTLIFVFIFIGMAFAGGVNLLYFLSGGAALAAVFPYIWNNVMSQRQRNRFLVLFDPTLDPLGLDERYHSIRSLKSLTGGGMLGQGLFQGNRTQAGLLFAQHTDYIFSSIGEELGYVGCLLVLLLMAAIIARCIWVGCQSQNYMRRMICFGAAAALIFQVISNVGMCMGVTPVIGLTLPLISYGGSSIVTVYAMLGLVSGVYARPAPKSHERYIHPPLYTISPKRSRI